MQDTCKIVTGIIDSVKMKGDNALIELTKRFDGIELNRIQEVTPDEIKSAYGQLNQKQINAIKFAALRIENFARAQLPQEFSRDFGKGIKLGQIIRPIEKVGCYIPGGNYPLPSTVLMTVIPANVAGCPQIIVCSPPKKVDNKIIVDPAIIVACDIAGVDRIFKVGGAQAIAAMAYGTQSIPKVYKIVGPGNKYVTEAKLQLFGTVDIDIPAGPSEVLIIADESANPKFIAADLLAQAEHDRDAKCYLIITSKQIEQEAKNELKIQLEDLPEPNKSIASISIEQCEIILAKDLDEAVDLSNEIAPEHLEIQADVDISKIKNAGSIFIGNYSVEAAGDYCSGTNHTLPTSGFAKMRGGLSVQDFLKIISVQKISRQGLDTLRGPIGEIASMERLYAHKYSVEMRK